MIVLSIHDGHDAGACLIRDGELLLHSSEERRINVKNARGVPTKSISTILERTGIAPSEVDLVALCGAIRTIAADRKVNLDTSFNLHGSPIVGTPEAAIYTLVNSVLDAFVMGPFLVGRPDASA